VICRKSVKANKIVLGLNYLKTLKSISKLG
jgi:hypothetical protein